MNVEIVSNGRNSAVLFTGDCVEVMRGMEADSVDAVVCDPPYGLEFMGKEWDSPKMLGQMATGKEVRGAYAYGGSHSQGYYANDPHKFQAWTLMWAEEALRVLKPGGHLLAFGGTRTYHRLACAIEDAGFEIRDQIQWLYGSGFPKSMNVGKAIDKSGKRAGANLELLALHITECREAAGISKQEMASWFPYVEVTKNWERQDEGFRVPSEADYRVLMERIGCSDSWLDVVRAEDARRETGEVLTNRQGDGTVIGLAHTGVVREATTTVAKQWAGWGTALKPAHEPIVVARKPFKGTVAKNVLEHGTGALNIDGTRIGYEPGEVNFDRQQVQQNSGGTIDGAFGAASLIGSSIPTYKPEGRWPANIILGHHEECEEVGTKKVKAIKGGRKANITESGVYGGGKGIGATSTQGLTSEDVKGDPGYGDEDGMETVTAWDCHPDCPVRILDEQSGDRPGGNYPTQRGQAQATSFASGQITEGGPRKMGDSGGASRFFKQVDWSAEKEEEWQGRNHPQEGVSDVGQSSSPPSPQEDSAPGRVAVPGHPEDGPPERGLAQPSMSDMGSGSRPRGESGTPLILSTEQKFSPGLPQGSITTPSIPVSDAEGSQPTDITTTTPDPSTSDGSADPAISNSMSRSKDRGVQDSPSRFIYHAKASKKEREAGLEHLDEKLFAQSNGGQTDTQTGEERYDTKEGIGLNKVKKRRNNHPTVKPIALMRYLVRLVTPPGGRVLDPFVGSGTTVIAANLEGFDAVGIDQDETYIAIAAGRVRYWQETMSESGDGQGGISG